MKDEVLFRDSTTAEYIYFLLRGKLRVEKMVDVSAVNYWPEQKSNWCERTIMNRVLYKVSEIEPDSVIGEKECIGSLKWPVQVVAATSHTHLYMIHKKEALRSNYLYNIDHLL